MNLRESNKTPTELLSNIPSQESRLTVQNHNFNKLKKSKVIPQLEDFQKIWGYDINKFLNQRMQDANKDRGEYQFKALNSEFENKDFGKDGYGYFYYGECIKGTQKLNGQGVRIQPHKEILQGTFKNGVFEEGRVINSVGGIREGTFVNKELEGKGYQKTSTFTYQGDFKEGKFHGEGRREQTGVVYDGGWKNGDRHGKGKETYQGGNIEFYEGEWDNDKKHGAGKIKYRDDRPVMDVKYQNDERVRSGDVQIA